MRIFQGLNRGISPSAKAKQNDKTVKKDSAVINDELHKAVRNSETLKIEVLLAGKVDVNEIDQNGDTPLHLAVLQPKLQIISLLLGAKANVTLRNKAGLTPLHLAAQMGKTSALELLVVFGRANPQDLVSMIPSKRSNALFLAADSVSDSQILFNVLKLLIELKVSPNEHPVCYLSAIHLVALKKQPEAVLFLYEHGAEVKLNTTQEKQIKNKKEYHSAVNYIKQTLLTQAIKETGIFSDTAGSPGFPNISNIVATYTFSPSRCK